MLHPDDMVLTRWQRARRWIAALDLDGLLRWTLVANLVVVTLFCGLAVLSTLGSVLAGLLTLVREFF
jgi:hypothetical protein